MKKIIIAFVTMLMLAGSYEAKSQINGGISFNTFYNELNPYGRWVDYPDYGQVWISNENGFEPYATNGHWEFTNYGWMWVSDYAWGWAPFHYGRWAYLNNYGWAWVPGYDWAPAWVGWCNYDGYYGWAPLSPGIGFNYTFSSMPLNYWRFVRPQYINDPYVYRHYQRPVRNVNEYKNVTVINNTVVNNNTTYVTGPAQQDIEKITRKKIERKQVAFSQEGMKKTELVNKNEIKIFRPDVKNNATAENIKPAKQQPAPVTENEAANTQTAKTQTPAQQKEEFIKNQQAVKQQQAAVLNKQKNDEMTKQAEAEKQQQEVIRLKEQQNEIRKQQQDEARMQQQRQEQVRQRKESQNEMRQQKMQQHQETQQEEKTQRSFPQQHPSGEEQRPVKQGRKS